MFQIMVNKKRGKQNRISLRTIKICWFDLDGVKKKHANKFVLREQVGFAAVL